MGLKGDVHFCTCCKRFLRSTDFHMNCSETRLSVCDSCERLRNEAGPRINKTLFKAMLREIRRREDMFNDGSQVAYIIRVCMRCLSRYLLDRVREMLVVLQILYD